MISGLRISRLLPLNYDTEIEEDFRRLYRRTGTSRDEVKPRGRQAPPESACDVLCGNDFCADEATPLRLHGEFGVLSLFYGG